jgi:hypothetical protein
VSKSKKVKCPVCGSIAVVKTGVPNMDGADDCAVMCLRCRFKCCFHGLKNQKQLEILLSKSGIFEVE